MFETTRRVRNLFKRRDFFGRVFRLYKQGDDMNAFSDRVRFEHYWLTLISTWPESETKQVALATARAALDRELALWRIVPRS
jgi:hypothetical protein